MLTINKLNKCFYRGTENENTVFENFNLKINKGECTAILGSNGCGKSTLFNIISGVLTQDSGDIILNDKNIVTVQSLIFFTKKILRKIVIKY